jgi:AAA domain
VKPRVICLANQKGGVGKTTSAIHLAAGIARAGRTALLVDLDAQGNASSIFLESGVEPDESVCAVFKDRRPVAALKRKTRIPGLELLPASLNLAEVETLLADAAFSTYAAQARRPSWAYRLGARHPCLAFGVSASGSVWRSARGTSFRGLRPSATLALSRERGAPPAPVGFVFS